MHDFTTNWHWPQWVILALLLNRLFKHIARNGKPMVKTFGSDEGQPMIWNANYATLWTVIWIAVLICGGFFA